MQPRRTPLLAGTAAIVGALALVACIPPAPEPTPVPSPTPTPVVQPTAPPTVVTPTYDNWMDAPQTAGDWTYTAQAGQTLALFGTGTSRGDASLTIRCDLATRRVMIARRGTASSQVQMRIRTETQDRVLTAGTVSGTSGELAAELSARDSLLDAIAFSKGRFAVEVDGVPTIHVPAYPEITRVVEDCRS